MTMPRKETMSSLMELIRVRTLNSDGKGLILDRLPQRNLRNAFDWFLSNDGGMSGYRLLDAAPVFDTILEMNIISPGKAYEASGEKDGRSPDPGALRSKKEQPKGASFTGDVPSPDSAEATEAQENLRRIRIEDSSEEENCPQSRCYKFFGNGFFWGSYYLEFISGKGETPFPIEADVEDFISYISREEADPFLDLAGQSDYEERISPFSITEILVGCNPELEVILRAAYRLCSRMEVSPWEFAGCETYLRFLFFVGLIAAGLRLPIERLGNSEQI